MVAARDLARAEVSEPSSSTKTVPGMRQIVGGESDVCFRGSTDWKSPDDFEAACRLNQVTYFAFNTNFRTQALALAARLAKDGWSADDGNSISSIVHDYFDAEAGKPNPDEGGRAYGAADLPGVLLNKGDVTAWVAFAQRPTQNPDIGGYSRGDEESYYLVDTLPATNDSFAQAFKAGKYVVVLIVEKEYQRI